MNFGTPYYCVPNQNMLEKTMPRTARLVMPDHSHHVIQRGNRSQDVFFEPADYLKYLQLLTKICADAGTEIQAYCLMPDHVQLILSPKDLSGLRAIGEVHKQYTRYINRKKDWKGYLWQGRFSSYPMDDRYLYEALRYIELLPVRARLVKHPEDYPYSSAPLRLRGRIPAKLSGQIDDWKSYWQKGLARNNLSELIRQHERTQDYLK